ncbi:hypothetical protein D3C87_1866050 [compost metagenome]
MMAEKSVIRKKTRSMANVAIKPIPKLAAANSGAQNEAPETGDSDNMPNLMNLSTREVLRRLSGKDLKVKFVGQGVVHEVVPATGSAYPEDRNITVILR